MYFVAFTCAIIGMILGIFAKDMQLRYSSSLAYIYLGSTGCALLFVTTTLRAITRDTDWILVACLAALPIVGYATGWLIRYLNYPAQKDFRRLAVECTEIELDRQGRNPSIVNVRGMYEDFSNEQTPSWDSVLGFLVREVGMSEVGALELLEDTVKHKRCLPKNYQYPHRSARSKPQLLKL